MPFLSYNKYLKQTFGCRVYKVCIDGGFSCPNRDGTKGSGGCIFCDATGSSSRTNDPFTPIREQILTNIAVRRSRFGAEKFIAYFQSYTNTYAPVHQLKELYDEAISTHPDIIGLSVSTRADCVDQEKLELIASYRDKVPYVCVEYGLQTVHNKTLQQINRCETHEDFVKAIQLTQNLGLDQCAHVILGLPGETREDIRETAHRIAAYGIHGVKIHFLVAMEKTALAQRYLEDLWRPLTMEEGVSLACDFLERLSPSCLIYRIGGNGHPRHVVAPHWVHSHKEAFSQEIKKEFERRGTRQGSFYKTTE